MIIEPPHGASFAEARQPATVHLHDIERVFVGERVALSFATVAELLRRDIPVIVLSSGEHVLGLCLPPAPHRQARLCQFSSLLDDSFRLSLATLLVEAKILNQRRVLQRLAANRPDAEVTPLIRSLTHLAESTTQCASTDSLRGIEGTAAGRYFEVYDTFFPPTSPFERRSRRPPHNPPNAVLSYCYTLLAAEAEATLHAIGLDPAFGFYHEPADLRPSLALDLIEPFRAPVADAMTLDLFSHRTLNPTTHFEYRDGGVFLNSEGKKRFFVAYERRMEREFTSEQHAMRTNLRAEIERMARSLRDSFLSRQPFTPFLMN